MTEVDKVLHIANRNMILISSALTVHCSSDFLPDEGFKVKASAVAPFCGLHAQQEVQRVCAVTK